MEQLSTATWFYLYGVEVLNDPRCDDRLGFDGLMIGATLQRLSSQGQLLLDAVGRRAGPLWLLRIPTVLVSRIADGPPRHGCEARLLAELDKGPRQGHDLIHRMGKRGGGRVTFQEQARRELEAAEVGVRRLDDRGRPGTLDVDRRRKAALRPTFAPLAEAWLQFCADRDDILQALVRDVRVAHYRASGTGIDTSTVIFS